MIETPLGHLNFYIDGNPIDCEVNEIENDKSCAKLSGRYYVVIHFEPDGKRHCISCCIDEYTPSEKDSIESGERLELKSFYSESAKLSIGMEGDAGYMPDGRRISEYDYMVIQLTPLQSPVYRTAVLSELQYDRTKEAEICQSASRSGSASKLLPRNMPPKVIATLTSRRLVGQRALSALSVAVKSIVNSPAVCTSAMNAIIRLLSPPAHSCIVAVCP